MKNTRDPARKLLRSNGYIIIITKAETNASQGISGNKPDPDPD